MATAPNRLLDSLTALFFLLAFSSLWWPYNIPPHSHASPCLSFFFFFLFLSLYHEYYHSYSIFFLTFIFLSGSVFICLQSICLESIYPYVCMLVVFRVWAKDFTCNANQNNYKKNDTIKKKKENDACGGVSPPLFVYYVSLCLSLRRFLNCGGLVVVVVALQPDSLSSPFGVRTLMLLIGKIIIRSRLSNIVLEIYM